MMSEIPIGFGKVSKSNIVKEILRVGMIAELDAISLYEQLAVMTDRTDIKKAQDMLNGRPRKTLNWETPYEAYQRALR